MLLRAHDHGRHRFPTSSGLGLTRYGVGKDTVARIWQARRIRPWEVETFKLSTDPSFESKLRDVVGRT
jgi:hypothetical protein